MRRALLLGFLWLIALVGCGTADSSPTRFDAGGGTFNYGRNVGVAFFLAFDFSDTTELQEATVIISGPEGWNAGEPVARSLFIRPGRSHATLNLSSNELGEPIVATSGTYVLRLEVGGSEYRKQVPVDATQVLERITEIFEEELTSSTLRATWPPLPGAGSYFISIDDPRSNNGTLRLSTREPAATFTDLDLRPGDRFGMRIYAYSADLTGTVDLVPQPFNSAYTAAVVQYD